MVQIKNPTTVVSAGGSIDIVNGIIEQYKAENTTIDAQTFVEYINSGMPEAGTDTQLSTVADIGNSISAVLLNDGNVFIAHSYDNSNRYLYGMVCTISDSTITAGTDTQLSTTDNTGFYISAVLLDDGNVFIAHSYSNNRLYGMVCSVNGTTITHGTDTSLSTSNGTGLYISAVLLNDGNVFIAHNYNSSYYYLYGMVCSVNGTTITHGTDTSLSTDTSSAGSSTSAVLLNDGNVFIAHKNSGSEYLYGMVCTINGTTITHGTDTSLSTTYSTGSYISAVLLDDGNVFIAHSYGSSYYLYGMVCTINGTSITVGTDTQLSTVAHTGSRRISAVLLDDGNVFIAHSYDDSSTITTEEYLYGMVCTISGTTVTAGTDTQLSTSSGAGNNIFAVLLDDGNVFIAHSYSGSNRLYGVVADASDVIRVRAATNANNICGLTNEPITSSTAGDVWVLDTSNG